MKQNFIIKYFFFVQIVKFNLNKMVVQNPNLFISQNNFFNLVFIKLLVKQICTKK